MRKLLLGIALLSASFFSTASNNPSPGVYNLSCVKESKTPSITHVQADTNSGAFIFGAEKYYNAGEQAKGTDIVITYKSQYTKNTIILTIDTVQNTSTYTVNDGTEVFENGVCVFDDSVLI
jgi:hypothetical protein